MNALHRLRQVARPFVVRQLRGPRGRRALGLSALLGIVTVLLGMWLALGRGELEREVRIDLRLEQAPYDRAFRELVVVCYDDDCSPSDVVQLRRHALAELRDALLTYDPMRDKAHADLHLRAQEHVDQLRDLALFPSFETGWDWRSSEDRASLNAALAADLQPRMVKYVSPLGFSEALGLVGMIATFLVVLLGTVFGPVLTGIAVAQESHENTLPPITGTGLGGRDIIAGLVVAAFAPVAIVAAPQAAIALVASLVAGNVLVVLGVVALMLCCAWALAMTAAIAGLYVGRRRGPGPVGVAMLGLTSVWLMIGMGIGLGRTIGHAEVGSMIAGPSSALMLGTREAFFSVARLPGSSGAEVASLCLMPALAGLVLGALAFRAAARRVDDRAVPPLSRGEAVLATLIASFVCTLTTVVARGSSTERAGLAFATIAMMVLPLAALLVARVPAAQGDTRREISVSESMVELAAFTGIHLGVMLLLCPSSVLEAVPGLVHTAWAVAVTGLVALRMLSPGNRWLTGTWGGFCLLSAAIMMANGWELAERGARADIVALFQVSPLLGVIQLVLIVVVPLVLVLGIRRAARQ